MDWNTVAQWFSQPKNAVLMGQAANAVMGPHENTWQAQTGNVAAGFGQSKIANLAAQKQQADRQALIRALMASMGGGALATGAPKQAALTPEGEAGPTSRTENADGTYVEKGNVKSSGSVATPAKSQANAGAEAGARLLPFSLAEAVIRGSGGMPDLTGLSPEQISQVMKNDQTNAALMNSSVRSIFDNRVNQELANLYNTKANPVPTTGPATVKTVLEGQEVEIPIDNYAAILNARVNAAKSPAEIKKIMAEAEKAGVEADVLPTATQAKVATAKAAGVSAQAKASQARTTAVGLDIKRKNAATLAKDSETRIGELNRLSKKDEQQFESELAAHEGKADTDEDNVSDAVVYNRVVPGDRSKYYAIRDGEAVAYSLPKVQTKDGIYQLTMEDVRKLQKGKTVAGITFEANYTMQEILNTFADKTDSLQRK